MKLRVLAMISLAAILLLSACGQSGIKNALNWELADFTYINQDNEEFGLKDLEGKVWVADFIFTNCEDVCMPMTANMKKLQQLAEEEGIENIEFVSFSVDPKVDTPEVLKEFGSQYSADFSNWHFLTGYAQEDIEQYAMDYFKTIVKKPQTGDQVIHGTDFYLVDQEGKVMKYYTGLAEIPLDEIIKDIKALQ
ncbi:SCO family protein [Bacillus sp. ISL-47]|uniref:SCO family protein n=1 Tax=Bacillus sp. ISL-47 TaxID=2819130 RepID=UPI001BE785F3|nr:SCO family protein [Bacillus sp. ISL-47]MBT2690259.1 SCO family protein [Bacillus sp. ISL-47]MBT2708977.1 SCO family protein [Pseudomonas sp. ISL-84]